jgi:hypothetical protein
MQVSAGTGITCGLTLAGEMKCWGRNEYGQGEDQVDPFSMVSTSGQHTCGLKLDGSVECWGNNSSGQAEDQVGPYGPYAGLYDFDGFYPPVDNQPTINLTKAGSAIPVRFSLGGDRGMDIFAAGYPISRRLVCPAGNKDLIEETAAGSSGLKYDPLTDQYTYIWKTAKSWKGCWELILKFNDGPTAASALFELR